MKATYFLCSFLMILCYFLTISISMESQRCHTFFTFNNFILNSQNLNSGILLIKSKLSFEVCSNLCCNIQNCSFFLYKKVSHILSNKFENCFLYNGTPQLLKNSSISYLTFIVGVKHDTFEKYIITNNVNVGLWKSNLEKKSIPNIILNQKIKSYKAYSKRNNHNFWHQESNAQQPLFTHISKKTPAMLTQKFSPSLNLHLPFSFIPNYLQLMPIQSFSRESINIPNKRFQSQSDINILNNQAFERGKFRDFSYDQDGIMTTMDDDFKNGEGEDNSDANDTMKILDHFLITMPKPLSINTGKCNSEYEFKCLSGKPECIAIYDVCDKIPHCEDGSDEIDCPRLRTKTKNRVNNLPIRNVTSNYGFAEYMNQRFESLKSQIKHKKRRLLVGLFSTAILLFLLCLWLWRKMSKKEENMDNYLHNQGNPLARGLKSFLRQTYACLSSLNRGRKNLRWRRGIRRPDKKYYVNGLTLFEQYDKEEEGEEGKGLFKAYDETSSDYEDEDPLNLDVSRYKVKSQRTKNNKTAKSPSNVKYHPTTPKPEDDIFRRQDFMNYKNGNNGSTSRSNPKSPKWIKSVGSDTSFFTTAVNSNSTGRGLNKHESRPKLLPLNNLGAKRSDESQYTQQVGIEDETSLDLTQRFKPAKTSNNSLKDDFKAVSEKLKVAIKGGFVESSDIGGMNNSTSHFLDNFTTKAIKMKKANKSLKNINVPDFINDKQPNLLHNNKA